MGQERIEPLARFCRDRGVVILSDEIYGRIVFGDPRHVSPAVSYPEGTVVFSGLSKHLSLGGWRIGVALAPRGAVRVARAIAAIASEVWSTLAAPMQRAALTAFEGDPEIEDYIEACACLHQRRTRRLWDAVRDLGLLAPRPEGAFYTYVDFAPLAPGLARLGIRDGEALADWLLERHRVATLPGAAFGAAPSRYSLRLASSYLDTPESLSVDEVLRLARSPGGGADGPELGAAIATIGAAVSALR